MPSRLALSILVAAGAACGTAHALEPTLTEAEIRAEIIGQQLEARRLGMTVSILHAEDGTSTASMPMRTREGGWTIENDQLCVTWRNADETECSSFERVGDGQYRVGASGVTVSVVSGR